MPLGERPKQPGFEDLVRLADLPGGGKAAWTSDDEPPSGVVLRQEVLASVPRLVVSTAELMKLPLDSRAGFVVSFVDGSYTIEMILDACAMPRKEALGILGGLAARGIIVF
jgi:hypothetical protein